MTQLKSNKVKVKGIRNKVDWQPIQSPIGIIDAGQRVG